MWLIILYSTQLTPSSKTRYHLKFWDWGRGRQKGEATERLMGSDALWESFRLSVSRANLFLGGWKPTINSPSGFAFERSRMAQHYGKATAPWHCPAGVLLHAFMAGAFPPWCCWKTYKTLAKMSPNQLITVFILRNTITKHVETFWNVKRPVAGCFSHSFGITFC